MSDDINTLRAKHKLRLNIFRKSEKVLCTGKPEQFAITRFFWENVDCQACLAMKKSLLAKLFKR